MKFLKYSILVLLSSLSTAGLYSMEEKNDSIESIKLAAEKLRDDFANLSATIKATTDEQANATIGKIKDWAQQQEDSFKEAQVNLKDRIDQTKEDIQNKINEIATAVETKDEAKANTLLKELEAQINSSTQNLKIAAKPVKDKLESAQKEIKSKWDKALEDLKNSYQNNLKKFNDSLDEAKSYLKGFRDIIKRETAKQLVK